MDARKERFTKISKNLVKHIEVKIILLNQNNYVGLSNTLRELYDSCDCNMIK